MFMTSAGGKWREIQRCVYASQRARQRHTVTEADGEKRNLFLLLLKCGRLLTRYEKPADFFRVHCHLACQQIHNNNSIVDCGYRIAEPKTSNHK